MALPAALKALMTDVVTFEPLLDKDQWGEPSFGPPVEVHCYLVRHHVKAINRDGTEVTSEVQLFLADPLLAISVDDRLTLPNGSRPTIIEILSATDGKDPFYLEVRA